MARAFVTGASGFIGGALAARVLERGDEVVGLARSDEAAAVVSRRGAQVARGNLLDEDSIAEGMLRPRSSSRRCAHCGLGASDVDPEQHGRLRGQWVLTPAT